MDVEILSPKFKNRPVRGARLQLVLVVDDIGPVMPEQAERDDYRLNMATQAQQDALKAAGYNIPATHSR